MPSAVQLKNAEAVDRILPNIDNDMMRRNITLRQMCHVNENGEGDSFVGVKADTDGMTVFLLAMSSRKTMMIFVLMFIISSVCWRHS